jgi:hypothetical protein
VDDAKPRDRRAKELAWLEPTVFVLALVVFILGTGGGPGWGSSIHVVLATRLVHVATAPLYDVLASIASLVPAGEPGFRLGVLGALLGAATLAGVVAAVRALVPREPSTGLVAALLLAIAPPFREATAFATPSILAACGTAWAIAFALRYARDSRDIPPIGTSIPPLTDARDAAAAIAACAVVVGSAPWLGAALTIAVAIFLARRGAPRTILAVSVGALGLAVVALWWSALGGAPGANGSLAATIGETRGAAAIVVGVGLVGIGFGALTGLPFAAWLALVALVVAGHQIIVGGAPSTMLVAFAIGAAIVPSAVVRALAHGHGWRRQLLAFSVGLPLVAAAALAIDRFSVDDPGSAPHDLAFDLESSVPPGPGVFVATRTTSWLALAHEATIAGARPDLALVSPRPSDEADTIVADTLRADRIAAADAATVGRLDPRRTIPRGRGFQLVQEIPERAMPVAPPATYATATGREQGILLALERARFEAASGRYDLAARAAGLAERFGAADLAVLAATTVTPLRPPLFEHLPLAGEPVGPWLLELYGDDLAWIAGLPEPELPADAPMPRRLHAKWREILTGRTTPDDPAIAEMGLSAIIATRTRFVASP